MILRHGLVAAALCIGLITTVFAQPWEFGQPVVVTTTQGEGTFHHLESSGRRNIAVSGNTVGIVWEDDHRGTPTIYLGQKALATNEFDAAPRLSGDGEAYEPSLAALGEGRFVAAWEEDGRVHLRLVEQGKPGPTLQLDDRQAGQASLTRDGKNLLLVYAASDQPTRHSRIYLRQIGIDGTALEAGQRCAVDSEQLKQAQLYPAVVQLTGRTLVAWEDRRHGHTVIMAAENRSDQLCKFGPPQRISEALSGPRPPYGKGHGVTRVAMHSYGANRVLAAWADKRDFREAYDIYASHYPAENKARLFGANQKVQDVFGGMAQQWQPSVAGHPGGQLVVAWADGRDDETNILLSWYANGQWSDDLGVPGASGAPIQNHPSITLDHNGNLHLAWVERDKIGGATRLRYLFGRVNPPD